ncbi:MAG: putative DNA-binding protein [Clostridia bacterium]|nr:putative DNA-binding protein [Clostridia bacterium]
MEEKIKMSILCGIYGNLLTEKQHQILDDYYNNDLSLSEIAENNKITRQAVKDVINKGKAKLHEYEEKLLFMYKVLNQEKVINEIIEDLEKIENKELTKDKLSKISKKLKTLIEE